MRNVSDERKKYERFDFEIHSSITNNIDFLIINNIVSFTTMATYPRILILAFSMYSVQIHRF